MHSQDLIVAPTQGRPPALISGRDRIEHFQRAAIDNDNTRRAYGRALGSFCSFLEDGGKEPVQDVGPLDVRDYLGAAKASGLSTAKSLQRGSRQLCTGSDLSCRSKHVACQHYSITSSARETKDSGITSPIALAAFRLMTSWYLVGSCSGRDRKSVV